MPTPRSAARESAGLSVEDAARRARVTPAYLRRVERHGGAPYRLATRLARLYGCRIDLFLPADTRAAGLRPGRS